MGVTLERVQNKFACIIGELCSEPDILSQFAIWLDLRLAEYKAKGAISLDCSGSDPDPTWLRGYKGKGGCRKQRDITHERLSRIPEFYVGGSELEDETNRVCDSGGSVFQDEPSGFKTESQHFQLKDRNFSDKSTDLHNVDSRPENDLDVMGDRRATDCRSNLIPKSPVFPIHMYKITSRKRPLSNDSAHTNRIPGQNTDMSVGTIVGGVSSRKQPRLDSAELDIHGVTQSLTSIIGSDISISKSDAPLNSERCKEQLVRAESQCSSTGANTTAASSPEPQVEIVVKTENPSGGFSENHIQLSGGGFPFMKDDSCSADVPFTAETVSLPHRGTVPFSSPIKDSPTSMKSKPPMNCEDCGAVFYRYDSFRRHRRSHSANKKFYCSLCSKTFTRNEHLKRHQKGVHYEHFCEDTFQPAVGSDADIDLIIPT